MKKSLQLRIALLIILGGLFVSQYIHFHSILLIITTGLGILIWYYRVFIFIAFFIGALSLSFGSYRMLKTYNPLQKVQSEQTEIQGFVTSFPDRRISSTRVKVKIFSINKERIKKKHQPSVLLIFPPGQTLSYGQVIQFSGKPNRPRNFQSFNYVKYLDRFGISHIIKNPKSLTVLRGKKGWQALRVAESLRNKFENNLSQLPEPHATIAMGILLGVKKELPPPVTKHFKDSGLMHILVVSGFNISVIMILCNFWFRRFGPIINIILSLIIILFFVLMTGSEAPVVRAAIMGSLVGLAVCSGRFSESKNVILLSAVIIGLMNPKTIQADLGFYFSFAATLGIILLVPILTPYFQWLTNRFEFRNILMVSLASQIAVFPLQTFFFEAFPTGGLLANQLTEPIIPIAMLLSSFIAVLGFLPDSLVKLITIPAMIPLQLLITTAEWFHYFPVIQTNKIIGLSSGFIGIIGSILKIIKDDTIEKRTDDKNRSG